MLTSWKRQNIHSSLRPLEEVWPHWHLDLSSVKLILGYDCRTTREYISSGLPDLWSFVVAATENQYAWVIMKELFTSREVLSTCVSSYEYRLFKKGWHWFLPKILASLSITVRVSYCWMGSLVPFLHLSLFMRPKREEHQFLRSLQQFPWIFQPLSWEAQMEPRCWRPSLQLSTYQEGTDRNVSKPYWCPWTCNSGFISPLTHLSP